jgi:hypothetical protein
LTNPSVCFKSGLKCCGILLIAVATIRTPGLFAQEPGSALTQHEAADLLPDAPSSAISHEPQATPFAGISAPTAGIYTKYIGPDQAALPLTASNKVVFGVRNAFSPTSMLIWTLAAGYETAIDGSPNYGEGTIGFTKRVGAAVLRDSTDGIFTDSIFAPIYHQDPRYYKLGPSRGRAYRVLYAVTRPLITRTDGGHAAPNLSLLSGDLFGSWLTNAYYPRIDRGFDETAKTFAGSLASAAFGNVIQEFMDDLIQLGHGKPQR